MRIIEDLPHVNSLSDPGKVSIAVGATQAKRITFRGDDGVVPVGTLELRLADIDILSDKVFLFEDFLGTSGLGTDAIKWTKTDTGTGTQVSDAADEVNGAVQLDILNTSEAEEATILWGDQLLLKAGQGLIMEFRVKLSILPTSGTKVVMGLGSNRNADPDSVANNAWFLAAGSGAILAESDDGTIDNDDVSTGITVLATEWHLYRIDASDADNVKFYIDGARVAAATTFKFGANKAQPYFQAFKASGTSVGTTLIDYVRITQNRA